MSFSVETNIKTVSLQPYASHTALTLLWTLTVWLRLTQRFDYAGMGRKSHVQLQWRQRASLERAESTSEGWAKYVALTHGGQAM